MATIAEIEKDFKRLIEREALGHAYVLHGPQASPQLLFAQGLAHFLETGVWPTLVPEAASHPATALLLDARFIDGSSQHLGVDTAREFSEFLYRHPVRSTRRTLIVHSAAELTSQAQNAILKLVEEPPAHALIMLTVRDVNSLLPPLRSRLQMFYIAPERGGQEAVSERDEHARQLAEEFLIANAAGRSALIKQIVEADKEEDVEKSSKIVDTFVSCLIAELAQHPERNSRVLAQVLTRQVAMRDYSTSKKLQLEALLHYLQ